MAPSPCVSLESVSERDFGRYYWQYFGFRRGWEIMGWALFAIATGAHDPAELRQSMEQRGLTQGGMYKVLKEVRAFGAWIEGREDLPTLPQGLELARRVAVNHSTIVECVV